MGSLLYRVSHVPLSDGFTVLGSYVGRVRVFTGTQTRAQQEEGSLWALQGTQALQKMLTALSEFVTVFLKVGGWAASG